MTGVPLTLRIAAYARAFTFLALAGVVLWLRDTELVPGLLVIGACWLVVALLERRPGSSYPQSLVDGAVVGLVCGLSLPEPNGLLLALTLPPFATAVLYGARASALTYSAQFASLVLVSFLNVEGIDQPEGIAVFTWATATAGAAIVGALLHRTVFTNPGELVPYVDAQRLIRQLLDLSSELRSGLDASTLAGEIASQVGDVLPSSSITVAAVRGDTLVPFGTASHPEATEIALLAWNHTSPVVEESVFAFRLGTAAVVSGVLSPDARLQRHDVARAIRDVVPLLTPKLVQLETALLFTDLREAASADVRSRLAREMHDGIAQDIASLGYTVDALALTAATPDQEAQFQALRERITAIVAEVRQSVLNLRTSLGEASSLGEAIGTVARHLSESSRIPISVVLDEYPTRLHPDVEAELFRIAQEAMNNAIRHAHATEIEVQCQVHAPLARILITDNGRGLQQPRPDSMGMKIMSERARLASGNLTITEGPDGVGLRVAVEIGG